MDYTILGQGTFTQGALTAVAQTIIIPSGVDHLNIYNFTQAALTAGNGYHFYWQRGMPSGKGIVEFAGGAHAVTVNQTAANNFVLYDPSLALNGAINNGSTGVTGFTAANPAVVTVGSTAGMAAGNLVRFDTLNNQPQYAGIDFSVGYGTLTATTMSLDYLNATSSTPSTSGNFRVRPLGLFYPARRVITIITTGFPTVVTLSVDHGFTVGQELRFSIKNPLVWGSFTQLDGVQGAVTAVDVGTGVGHNTVSLNIDSTGLVGPAGLSWAATFAELPSGAFTPGELIPVGEDTATSLNSIFQQTPQINLIQIYNSNVGLLADSTVNTGYLGMTLAAGASSPAGVASDVVFWVAGKSTYGGL